MKVICAKTRALSMCDLNLLVEEYGPMRAVVVHPILMNHIRRYWNACGISYLPLFGVCINECLWVECEGVPPSSVTLLCDKEVVVVDGYDPSLAVTA